MANTVIALKKSATPSAAPAALANGELALNYADGKLYYKHANGTIASISGNEPNYFGTVNANSVLIVSDTPGDILSITPGNNISIVGDAVNDSVTIGLKDDVTVPGLLSITAASGDEGGEIRLANAITNSLLAGPVNIDIFRNQLRFFVSGGDARGAFINLASTSAGVGTDLLAAASSTDAVARTTANAAFDKANAALPNVSGTWFNGTLTASQNLVADKIISSNNGNSENFKVGDDAWIGDYNTANSLKVKGQQNSSIGYISFGIDDAKALGRAGTGPLTYDGSTIWHAGNDGTGSTLDADLLDGQHGSYYGTAADVIAAFAKANAANVLAFNTGAGANAYAEAVGTAGNSYTVTVGAAANAWANSISATRSTASNAYAVSVGTAGNAYTQTVGTAGNAYAVSVGTAGNAYTQTVGTAGNSYAQTVGTAGNSYTITVGTAANGWANTVGADAKGYANSTFVKLTAASQTITGNLSVVGTFSVSGNTTIVNAENLRVSDPLIFLASNNDVSDIVDIGFIGGYVNATGSNVHTGLYREHEDKMYYLFQGYDKEPANNHIGALSNNMTLAVLNADLRTSNLTLAGTNTVVWIRSSYDQANTSRTHANTAHLTANAAFDQANTARTGANTVGDYANAAFLQANTARTHANAAHLTANAGFDQANTARTHANAAFGVANTAVQNTASSLFIGKANNSVYIDGIIGTSVLAYRGSITETVGGDSTSNTTRNTGVYTVNYPGAADALIDIGGIGGSSPRIQMRFRYDDEMYFRIARDSEVNFDSATPYTNRVWHSGNDGASSGLDADLLDGQHGSYYGTATAEAAAFLTANTAYAHANAAHLTANVAYVQANTARTHANSAHLTANAAFDQANTARTHANAAFATANSRVSSVSGTGTVSGLTLTGTVTTSGSLTLGGVINPQFSGDSVTKDDITTRTDSGIYESASGTTAEGWPVNSASWQHLIAATHSNDANYYSMQIGATFFEQDWYFRNTNGSGTTGWSKVWHNNNDGASSGLDADLLDGQHGSYYGTATAEAAAFLTANTAYAHANAAFATANSRVSSVSGTGTVSGLTLTGTVTTSGSLTLGGTLSASVIDNMTDEHRLFNNMGENHTTRSSFDATTPSYNFGWRYVAGSTNGPGTGSQYYSEYVGLGNDYLATGAGSYGMQIAYPRNATTPYISIRYNEGNSFTAWQKISAGYADNAGTLDSIDSTQFMRTDAVSTHTTGKYTIYTPSGAVGTASGANNLEIFQPNAGSDAFLTFHISGDYAANFGIDGTTNDLFYGGWSAGANKYRVWHAGNDGTTSGLDADLLDGQHGSYYGIAADVAAAFAKANTGGSVTISTDARNITTYIMFEDSTSGALANANVSTSLTFNPSTGTLSSTIFNSTSDKTLKYDIEPIKNALVDIDTISGVKFKWVNNDHPSMGVIAQEVEKVFPELINNDNEIKTVNYNGIIAVLIEAVKELKAEVEVLKNR